VNINRSIIKIIIHFVALLQINCATNIFEYSSMNQRRNSHLVFIDDASERFTISLKLKIDGDEYNRNIIKNKKNVKIIASLEPGFRSVYFCIQKSVLKPFDGAYQNSNCFDEQVNIFNLGGLLGVYGRSIEVEPNTVYKIRYLKIQDQKWLYFMKQPSITNSILFLIDLPLSPIFYPVGRFPIYYEEYAYKFESETVKLGDDISKEMVKMGKVEKRDDQYVLDKSKTCDDTIYYVVDSNKRIIAKSIVEENDGELPANFCSKLRIFYANMEVKAGYEVYAFSKEPHRNNRE